MQNKGAISALAIAFAFVSLYYLSFTFITSGVEKDAKQFSERFKKQAVEYSKGDKTKEEEFLQHKEFLYKDSMSGVSVYPLLGYTYKECKERELNLGLDLKGGMNVTMEISTSELLRSLANHSTDSTFVKALEAAKKEQANSQEDFVTLFGKAFEKVDPNAKLAAIFSTLDLKEKITLSSSNADVLKILHAEMKDAVDNSFNILRSRIDKFGVTQPNIQRLGDGTGRILVELPGVKEPERVRKLLQGTANLEIWETYEATEIWDAVSKANDRLKDIIASKANKKATADTSKTAIAGTTGNGTSVASADSTKKDTTKSLVQQLSKKDTSSKTGKGGKSGSKEEARKNNPLFALLVPATNQQGQLQTGAAVGYAHYKDTATINAYLNYPAVKALFPRDLRLMWEVKSFDKEGNFYHLVAIKSGRDGKAALDGGVITDAVGEVGQNQATAVVNMTMNAEGASAWAKLTKQNIGRQVAIVLDGYVYSYPVVRSEINGGHTEISGNFTISEAKDLANILKSGKLPAPARIVEEAVVGPSLGKEAIDSGMMSFIVAFIGIMIYMFCYYNRSGLVADTALMVNLFFIFGILASLGAVLTLPGIAGLVLTMASAVDANVLIYERIKEELRLGKGYRLAIADGFKHSYSAIIDSNVTHLLTGIILYVFGHGPIKGFATTLIIGILTSLFTSIFISRLIYEWFLSKNKTLPISHKWSQNFLHDVAIPFINKRRIGYAISITITALGLIFLLVRGLDKSVDFTGGRTYVIRFDKDVKTSDIADKLAIVFGHAPEVKTFGAGTQVKITTKYMIEDNQATTDSLVEKKLYEGLKPFFGKDVDYSRFVIDHKMSSQKVGPTVADDIKTSAVWAVLFAILVIFSYIFIRFKGWQFGVGAITSIIHDVVVVLGLFSILYGFVPFSLEMDQAFIAAILTVVGYSINDTVIIFDRIREYVNNDKHTHSREVVFNSALNSTLSRTMNTSFTTLFVLFIMFFFGGEVIRGFVFALLIGVFTGTYSSFFVATPLAFDTMKTVEKVVEKVKAKRDLPKA